jgi:hypothetical protein
LKNIVISASNTVPEITTEVLKISDQGLKKPKADGSFDLYATDNNDIAKGKFYIIPGDYHLNNFVVNKNASNPIPRNQLSYESGRFFLRCPPMCTDETDICNHYSLLHFKVLEGIAKIIVSWEQTHPTSDLRIEGSYRCKKYNSTLKSDTWSAHQFGLKADLDLNLPDKDEKDWIPDYDTQQDTFREFCITDKNWFGLFPYKYWIVNENYPEGTDCKWADLRYINFSDGPYFSEKLFPELNY